MAHWNLEILVRLSTAGCFNSSGTPLAFVKSILVRSSPSSPCERPSPNKSSSESDGIANGSGAAVFTAMVFDCDVLLRLLFDDGSTSLSKLRRRGGGGILAENDCCELCDGGSSPLSVVKDVFCESPTLEELICVVDREGAPNVRPQADVRRGGAADPGLLGGAW